MASGTAASLTDSADVPQVNFDTATPVDLEALRDAGIAAEALRPLHYRLTSEPSPAGIAALASCLAAQNVILRNLHTSHRNLEEVFLDLTGRDMRS